MPETNRSNKAQPLFLGIGVQKGGTTWLHLNLSKHSDLWLPPIKEVHYFDRSRDYPTQSQLAYSNFFSRMMHRQCRRFLRNDFKWANNHLKRGEFFDYFWVWRYHFMRPNDATYLKWLSHPRVKHTAEVTPSYSILLKDDIAKVKKLLPNTKIILFLRDPVDRAWSHLRFNLKGRSLDESGLDLQAWLASPAQEMRGNYLRILENWQEYYGPEQMRVEFFDSIRTEPEALLARTLDFLNLDPIGLPGDLNVKRRHNASEGGKMPEDFRRIASEYYLPMLKRLAERYEKPCSGWLRRAEASVA